MQYRGQRIAVLLLCALCLALAAGANATTYYVNGATGSDDNPGARELPWRTISRGDALGRLVPGDTVLVAGGSYSTQPLGYVFSNCSGTSIAPITYRAMGRVVIDQSNVATPDLYCFGFTFMSVSYNVLDGFEMKGSEWGAWSNSAATCHHNTITNCIVHDARATGSGEHGGFYIADSDDWTIDHCLFYNLNGGIGVHSDASLNLGIYNNTMVDGMTGVDLHHGGSVVVKNNIIRGMTLAGLLYASESPLTAENSYNLFYQNAANYSGTASAGSHETTADPKFVSVACSDYRLQSTSSAVDTGTTLLWGHEGQGPDMGAFEYAPAVQVQSIGDLKALSPGQPVEIVSPMVVTAATGTFADGGIYIEEPTRASGIKVIPRAGMPTVALGERITFTGSMGLDINDEPIVDGICITSQVVGTPLSPVGMTGKGLSDPIGLDPTGLLVRIWGTVTFQAADGSYVFVDDGSGQTDDSGRTGVMVPLAGLGSPLNTALTINQFVSITGLAGMGPSGSGVARVVRPRDSMDITTGSVIIDDGAIAHNWVLANLGQTQFKLPFSFIYNGQSAWSILGAWQRSYSQTQLDAQRMQRTTTYTDPATGLQVRCVSIEYLDVPGVEWTVYFKNTGASDTPIIEDIQVMDTDFWTTTAGDHTLYYSDGSTCAVTDFQPRQQALASNSTMTLAPNGGRSSDGVLPFFNLAKPDGSGVVIAIGWTGQWEASFTRGSTPSTNVRTGMELTHLKLLPGEEIRTPSNLLVFWSGGDRMRGNNQLRKLLLAHFAPRPGGQLLDPPIAAACCVPFEQSAQSNLIPALNNIGTHALPVDSYWLDAGWYPCGGSWTNTGTWDPDPARYPNGMKPIADAAHASNLKFILWFEPERVAANTWLTLTHPEWVIGGSGGGLLNLGNPEALAWVKSKIGGMIANTGIDCYRQDFNMAPIGYWRGSDASDRQGITEIKHITGLYEYWDYLLAQNPNIFIDNCASGGRRLDLETARRSIPLLRTDYSSGVDAFQGHEYGLAQWLPMHGSWATSLTPYDFRSGMGTNMYVAFNFYDIPIPENGCSGATVWQSLTDTINAYKSVKPYYLGDFYPKSAYSTSTNVWMAWQFDRPDLGEGMLQAFRRASNTSTMTNYKLSGLVPTATYRVTNVDTGASSNMTGASLMQNGIYVSITAKPGSAILQYKRLD